MKLVTNISKLKVAVKPSKITDDELDEIENLLVEQLEYHGGVGLSANQLGIEKRCCIIQLPGQQYIFLHNPKIVERSPKQVTYREACLSLPKTLKPNGGVTTVRHERVVVEADNYEGQLVFEPTDSESWESNPNNFWSDIGMYESVVVQHEIDHLDGITIKDRVWVPKIEKFHKYGRNDKVMLQDPDTGDMKFLKYKHAQSFLDMGWVLQ